MTFFKSSSVSDKEKTFRKIFDQYYADLLRFARFKVSDKDRAEDLVQESFLKLWNQFDSEIGNVKSLLFKILTNMITDEYRKKKFDIVDDKTDLIVSEEATHDEDVFQIVDALQDDLKTIFIMNKYSGFKYAEIAEIMGVSIKTVEARMSKALKILKEKIKK